MDEDTLEILSEEAIIVYLNYLDQLKQLFTSFVHPNFNAGKKVLSMILNSVAFELEGHRREELLNDMQMLS